MLEVPHPGSPELRYPLYERMIAAAGEITGLDIKVHRVADEGELERLRPETTAVAGYQDGVLYISRATAVRIERLLKGDLYIHARDEAGRSRVLADLTTDMVTILHELIHAGAANEPRGRGDMAFHEGIAELVAQRERNAFMIALGLEKLEPGLLTSPFYVAYPAEAAAVNVLVYAAALRTGQDRRDEAMRLAHDGNLSAVTRRINSASRGVRLFGRAGLLLGLRAGFDRVARATESRDGAEMAQQAGHRIGIAMAGFVLNVSDERAAKQLGAEGLGGLNA